MDFHGALGSYGKGHWPQLNSFISSSILIRKAQWFASSSQSFIRIKYCSLNDIYYYSANFFFFFNPSCPSILWLLPRSNCLFLGVQRSCIRLKEPLTGSLNPGHALGYWSVCPGSTGLISQGLSFLVKIKGAVGDLKPPGS